MISHYAIQDYLNRKFESHTWMKGLSIREMKKDLRGPDYHPDFRFKTEPMKHQLASFLIGINYEHFLFLLDMGLGKSKLLLDIATYRFLDGTIKKPVLVVVPNAANCYGWEEEVEKHSDLSYVNLWAPTPKQRKKALANPGDIYVINYAGLQSMMTDLVAQKGKKKKVRMPHPELVEEFTSHFDMLALDELHFCKSPDSLTTHLACMISEEVRCTYGLTGTLMNKPEDIWSQYRVVDHGRTFGDQPEIFYEAFFHEIRNSFGSTIEFDRRQRRQLHRMIQNRAIRYVDTECNDLPRQVLTHKPYRLQGKQKEAYEDLINKIREVRDDDTVVVEDTYIKLRSIASGFLKLVDPDTGEVTYLDFADNPKLDIIEDLVTAMPHTSKMVIFHDFQRSGHLISQRLKEMKINHVRLYSGTKNKASALKKFKEDDSVHVMVSNIISGHAGHNWQHANYTVYYDPISSPIIRDQADKRTHRTGQKKACFYYDLAGRNTVEERILRNLKDGKDLAESIVDGKSLKKLVGVL